jgi:hypothetical protein
MTDQPSTQPWTCPKEDCDLGVEQHNLALAIEHIYGGTPTKSGRDFDKAESQEVADRILDKLADGIER